MEARLGVPLMHRTTRRMGLTQEGEIYLEHARRILADIDGMEQLVSGALARPRPAARECHAGFRAQPHRAADQQLRPSHPEVQVQLQLSVNPPPLTEDALTSACALASRPTRA
jgi:LysR family transcriptional activator of dmlA